MTEEELDRLLAEAAAEAPAVSPRYLAEALAAALAEQPEQPRMRPVARQGRGLPWLRLWQRRSLSGGGIGMGTAAVSLAAVAVLGGVIGYTDPGSVAEELLARPDPGLELVPAIEPFLAET